MLPPLATSTPRRVVNRDIFLEDCLETRDGGTAVRRQMKRGGGAVVLVCSDRLCQTVIHSVVQINIPVCEVVTADPLLLVQRSNRDPKLHSAYRRPVYVHVSVDVGVSGIAHWVVGNNMNR